jgi:L-fuconolactonase
MRIDAHHHVWDLEIRDQPWTVNIPPLRRSFGMAELQPLLVAERIDRTILVQTVTVADETPELVELAAAHDKIASVVGWVDLTASDVAQRRAILGDLPGGGFLVGIRHQVQEEPDPDWLARTDVRRGLRAVAEAWLAYDLILRKLSGLVTNASLDWTVADLRPYAEHVLSTFGAQRTLFGSDWPVCTLHAAYGHVIDAFAQLIEHLSESEQAGVFGDNAVNWYQLDELRADVA